MSVEDTMSVSHNVMKYNRKNKQSLMWTTE